MNIRSQIKDLKRVVVKLGTKVLVDEKGRLVESRIECIVNQCANLIKDGREVVLVSSGAVGAGLKVLGIDKRPDDLADKQLAAAVGQAQLVALYERLFATAGNHVGQVLLTHDNLSDPTQRENVKNAMRNLLDHNVIPLVNENDVVSVEELKFGDNDRLASMVAELLEADLLVLLTTADGLHDQDDKVISHVPVLTDKERSYVYEDDNGISSGGMGSKLESASLATRTCKFSLIASGLEEKVLEKVFAGEDVGTLIGTGE